MLFERVRFIADEVLELQLGTSELVLPVLFLIVIQILEREVSPHLT